MVYQLVKNFAFHFDPETVHNIALRFFQNFPKVSATFFPGVKEDNRYHVSLNGLDMKFPVGVAAGLDKEGIALDYFSRVGFGAIEVGTVTPLHQPGNPKPRIFRYVKENSIRNSMGFPSQGIKRTLNNISLYNCSSTLGVNLGKNKTTPDEESYRDYVELYKEFAPVADYLVINLSSPNTPGLRSLQHGKALEKILSSLDNERKKHKTKLYLKISPDLEPSNVVDIVDVVKHYKLDGMVATNTTVMPNLGDGGVSGDLLFDKAAKIRKHVLELTANTPEIDIIGSGGFSNFSQILDFWKAGGKFVQIYTSFIYKGPSLLKEIQMEIDKILLRENAASLQELFDKKYFISG